MSLPDYLLDELDRPYCQEHGFVKPCPLCRFEHDMEKWEGQRDE